MALTLEVDMLAEAAYISLSEESVARTVQASEDVLVDLDAYGVVVGIEVLRLNADLPFGRLVADFHVHQSVIDLLRQIQPSVSGFLTLTQGVDGTTEEQSPETLAVNR